ncbi:hypothetical protein ACR78Z_23250 [Sphingobacterium thalpophilum]|uniref:Anti-sigma factor n=1 Tax=Sphingobacterium thalpophilum TaxID=259 RepID=A0ABV4H7D2_9SPHI|nr:hypothetical protein [Sphingobacterium thalpophilum]
MMENSRLKELRDKYFGGKSSLEEEDELKKSNDFFFRILDQEKKVEMDWPFEDFVEQTQDRNVVTVPWWKSVWVKYAAAAVIFMTIGMIFYMNQNQPPSTAPVFVHRDVRPNVGARAESVEEVTAKTPQDNKEIVVEQRTAVRTEQPPKKRYQGKRAEARGREHESSEGLSSSDGYQADYVVLNGKPVANEEEAVELTLKSLGLLANNLENGMDKAMNIKQMSITIN